MPPLASYAVQDDASRGRRVAEREGEYESPFEFDRGRVLASTAFRRLRYKTQVFVTDSRQGGSSSGDHFRTRLTHTLEVDAQAQRLARLLSLNEGLAGAIALAHDLGHPPFGHAGEEALAEILGDHGGFEHNLQSLRVVDYLEHPYPAFRGLNLSFELRESLVKHRTRYDKPEVRGQGSEVSIDELWASGPQPPLEGQVANLADLIAYTLHDIEDGLLEGVLDEASLSKSGLWRAAAEAIRKSYGDLPLHSVRRPILDRIARRIHEDVRTESARRIAAAGVKTVDEVRAQKLELIGFSPALQAEIDELAGLLFDCLYRNHRVVRMDSKARRLIRELFDAYLAEPQLMPGRFAARVAEQGLHRVICDYIAGMTDRFCQEEHRRLFAPFHFE